MIARERGGGPGAASYRNKIQGGSMCGGHEGRVREEKGQHGGRKGKVATGKGR